MAAEYAPIIEQIIDRCWSQGETAYLQFQTRAAATSALDPGIEALPASTANPVAQSITAPTFAPTFAVPAITAPNITDPNFTDNSNINALITDATGALNTVFNNLANRVASFKEAYFPDDSDVFNAAVNWLEAAMASPTGLPVAVANALMADEQARVMDEADRATADVIATFARLRMPLPTGAALDATVQIQNKAQQAMAEASRKVTLMSVEQFRFLITEVVKLREEAMKTTLDYIKAIASGPDPTHVLGIGYDRQAKMVSANASYLQARAAAAEVSVKAQTAAASTYAELQGKVLAAEADLAGRQLAADTDLKGKYMAVDADLKGRFIGADADLKGRFIGAMSGVYDGRLKALVADAQSAGQIAAACFNNLHAGASVSDTNGFDRKVSYNYSGDVSSPIAPLG